MQLPIYFVRPAKWKKYFNLINSEKDASRTRAIEIFPYFSSQLSKKKDANKADAILIASFIMKLIKQRNNPKTLRQNHDTFKCEKTSWKLIFRLKQWDLPQVQIFL